MKYDATMLDIGNDKQIFVDDLLIESVENICRTWINRSEPATPQSSSRTNLGSISPTSRSTALA